MNCFIIQYVDPGAGSLLLQLLLSVFIGLGFYLITLRRRLKNWFKRQPADNSAYPSPQPEKIETEKTNSVQSKDKPDVTI